MNNSILFLAWADGFDVTCVVPPSEMGFCSIIYKFTLKIIHELRCIYNTFFLTKITSMWVVDGQTKKTLHGRGMEVFSGTFYPYPSHVRSFSLTLHHPTWKKLEVYTHWHTTFETQYLKDPKMFCWHIWWWGLHTCRTSTKQFITSSKDIVS